MYGFEGSLQSLQALRSPEAIVGGPLKLLWTSGSKHVFLRCRGKRSSTSSMIIVVFSTGWCALLGVPLLQSEDSTLVHSGKGCGEA